MPASTLKTEKARQTRAHFIHVARSLIVEEGIEALSMDRLASRAGYSKGACMYHFKSKSMLKDALMADYAEHLSSQLAAHRAQYIETPENAPYVLLHAYIDWYEGFEQTHDGWARLGVALLSLSGHEPERLEPIRAWYEALYDEVEAFPASIRHTVLVAILALEGLFFSAKFHMALKGAIRDEALSTLRAIAAQGNVKRRDNPPSISRAI